MNIDVSRLGSLLPRHLHDERCSNRREICNLNHLWFSDYKKLFFLFYHGDILRAAEWSWFGLHIAAVARRTSTHPYPRACTHLLPIASSSCASGTAFHYPQSNQTWHHPPSYLPPQPPLCARTFQPTTAKFWSKLSAAAEHKVHPRIVSSGQGAYLTIGGKDYLNFCSSHYLGFAEEPRLKKAVSDKQCTPVHHLNDSSL